jgi:ribosomal protein S18 acetylase RimI-like enzyme
MSDAIGTKTTNRIVSLAELSHVAPEPDQLEPLVRAVHGEGDRTPGWLSRKLHREHVVPELSRVALERGQGEHRERPNEQPVGYVLVGAAPGDPHARTCGGGVIPSLRGQGLGRALFEAAICGAAAAGFERLVVPAALERVGFFERLGFVRRNDIATLLAFATGSVDAIPFGAPEPWDVDGATCEHAGWMPHAWTRTEPALRATLHSDGAVVHLAREGLAVMAHRVLAPPGFDAPRVARAIDAVRHHMSAPTPMLVTGIAPVSSVTATLLEVGWDIIQRGVLVERDLRAPAGQAPPGRR